MRIHIGIDLGRNGAVAVLTEDGRILNLFSMPMISDKDIDFGELADKLERIKKGYGNDNYFSVIMESTFMIPGKMRANAIKTNFEGGGIVKGILIALGIRDILCVRPNMWQDQMFKGLDIKTDDTKVKSCAVASRIYGGEWEHTKNKQKRTGFADAICMAEYLRMKKAGLTMKEKKRR